MRKYLALVVIIAMVSFLAVGCIPGSSKDVLVIGGGGGGLVAAITAAEKGAKVVLVEKLPALGGNTLIAATGITASNTNLHTAERQFTVEDHITRTMDAAKTDKPNIELVKILAQQSADGFAWLQSLGLKYKLHATDNFWIIPESGHFGNQLVAALKTEAEKNKKNLTIMLDTEALELITDKNGAVIGAKVLDKKTNKTKEIRAKSVILATGGFGNAPDLMSEYNPNFKGAFSVMSTAGPTGDGFRMALKLNAGTVDMQYHQMRPLATPGYWIRETVLSEPEIGGILVNKEAKRFAAETLSPLQLVPQILAQTGRVGYVVFDSVVAATSNGKAAIANGQMVSADTIEALASKLGLNAEALGSTVDGYNAGQDEFGRTSMGVVQIGPFYGVEVRPSSHYTMAGLAFNKEAQILDAAGKPISGLYGVGEVLGGLYGSGRVAGNNTMDTVVFGKIAGASAAKLAGKK
ncbi:MAG: FAD-dependent oxidoreductase [Bacillota bacterium]|nr:FAD-dependent oxidoreductase [Bacillota bacterium]